MLILAVLAGLAGCGQTAPGEGKLRVAVTILPLAEFVERVGKDRVSVTVMVPPGADTHTYEPTPGQLAEVSQARMFVKVGSGLEFERAWMDKMLAANPRMLVVDSSKGVQLLAGGSGQDRGSSLARPEPHIWLSPLNARIMVENIHEGMTRVGPENKDYYFKNKEAYLNELDEVDQEIRRSLLGVKNRRFLVYHPAWGYFAREYGLEQTAIEEEGKEPSAQDIARAIHIASEQNIKVVFATPQLNPQSARVIAGEIGGRVVFIDDLAKDYVANLRRVLGELVKAME